MWEMTRSHWWSDLTQETHLSESLLIWHFLWSETQCLQDHMTKSLDLSQEDKLQCWIEELTELIVWQEDILDSENRTRTERDSVKHKS